jgi:hypothetical protein
MSPTWWAQLAPDQAPAPPGWWPPAPGWWGVALLLAVAVVLARAAMHPSRRRRRAALRELRAVRARVHDPLASARSVESILRRFALAQFGRERVARLTGKPWLEFLADHSGGRLSPSLGAQLMASAFGNAAPEDAADVRKSWLGAAEAFVKRAARSRSPSAGSRREAISR